MSLPSTPASVDAAGVAADTPSQHIPQCSGGIGRRLQPGSSRALSFLGANEQQQSSVGFSFLEGARPGAARIDQVSTSPTACSRRRNGDMHSGSGGVFSLIGDRTNKRRGKLLANLDT